MADMSIQGRLTRVEDPQEIANGKYIKRQFGLKETNETYPNTVSFDMLKKADDDYVKYVKEEFPAEVGDEVVVDFNIKETHHEKSGRYFNNINAWRVTPVGKKKKQSEQQASNDEEDEDLPF